MHLRRALLLFAIVLGMGALAASLSRPVDEGGQDGPASETGPATAAPAPSGAPPEPVSFDAGENESRGVRAGEASTLEVSVDEPGNVEIPELGLNAFGDGLTPARFEIFRSEPGEYEIVFTPSGGEAQPAGRLVVRSAG